MAKRRAKQYKRIDVTGYTPEQKRALLAFQQRVKATAAQRNEMAQAARAAFAATATAPEWTIATGHYPEAGKPPTDDDQHWNIGAPQVNYVDHIEGIDGDG